MTPVILLQQPLISEEIVPRTSEIPHYGDSNPSDKVNMVFTCDLAMSSSMLSFGSGYETKGLMNLSMCVLYTDPQHLTSPIYLKNSL